MKNINKRSLYQCFNAKVKDKDVYCSIGHKIANTPRGVLNILRLKRGEPLELSICQKCPDYNKTGNPLPKQDRGWSE